MAKWSRYLSLHPECSLELIHVCGESRCMRQFVPVPAGSGDKGDTVELGAGKHVRQLVLRSSSCSALDWCRDEV